MTSTPQVFRVGFARARILFTRKGGVASAVSFQLFLDCHDQDRLGVLSLYGAKPHAFSDAAIALGEVFAALCPSGLAAVIDKEGAKAALATRDTTGQAKGILA